MANKENMDMNANMDYKNYEFPESLRPTLSQCAEMYELIKHNLIEVDQEWLTVAGRHSLVIDFKLDLMYLLSFLAVMSGSPDEFPIVIADKMFEREPFADHTLGFIRAAENMGIKELIDNYNITDEVIEKFDAFTSNVTNILKILPSFGDYYELSMIYYLYSALIASICQLMEANAASSIIFTGINNYLSTQFKVCEEHMSPQELDQFEKTVFPYLKRVNAKMNEVVDSAKAYYGADDPINLKVGIKFPKPADDDGKKE